jgi:hypothetical protein
MERHRHTDGPIERKTDRKTEGQTDRQIMQGILNKDVTGSLFHLGTNVFTE